MGRTKHGPNGVLRAMLALCTSAALTGCATMSQSSTQDIVVLAYDQRDRPVAGMTCTLTNGMGESRFSTPAEKVTVRRSHSDLEIECTRGGEIARGTVQARRENLEQALVPFGWVAVGVDHLTGHLYAYPDLVRLRVGQHLRYEFSREARAAGVIAQLGTDTSADLAATPPRQDLPATTVPAAAAKPAATRAPRQAVDATPASARPATRATAPARSAPLTW
jgi:hypothetical protein